MSGLTFEQMNEWRQEAKKLLGDDFTTINPVEFYNFELDPKTYTDREVKDFDLTAVKSSDIILVNFEYPDTIGTAIEIDRAYSVWDKPVIAYGGDLLKVHPWMRESITKYSDTLIEAVQFIKDYYLPILQ